MSFYAPFTINTGTAGQTLKAALYSVTTNALTVKDITTGFTEQGTAGNYTFNYAYSAGYRDGVAIYTGTIGAGTDLSGVTVYGNTVIGAADELRITRGVPTLT